MFKKVQMKFFAIITSILLAVFIAVLVSINLIMEAVMQRQSKVVLKQIAAGIEYDDATSTFTYFPQNNDEKPPRDDAPPPEKPTGERPIEEIPTAPHEATEGQPPTEASTEDEGSNPTTDEQQPSETNIPTESNPDKTTQTKPEHRPQPETKTETGAETSPPSTQTEAVSTKKPEITTTAVEPNVPAMTTTAKGEQYPPEEFPHETRPNWEQRPEDWGEAYPPYHEWEEPPPYGPERYDDSNSEEYTEYPREFEDWKNDWCVYPEESKIYRDEPCYDRYCGVGGASVTEKSTTAAASEAATETVTETEPAEEGIMQLSAGNAPVLSGGFTVITPRSVEKAVVMKDTVDVPKSLGSIDFFVLMADEGGNYLASLNNEDLSSETAQIYISAIMEDGAYNGMLNSYQFCRLGKENGTVFVLTDKSAEMDMLDQLTRTTVLIGLIAFAVLSVIAFYFSKKSIEPIKLAFEKQKQFISDASHELKTPLTVISANADVLSEEIGKNKWLTYIKTQTDRMNVLVNDLLNLTRLENKAADFICTDFDLSKAVENTALPFECRAFEENKTFEIEVQEGLTVNGSEKHIKQMAAIFIDNALKYSEENGTVKVKLSAQGDKKVLTVFNTGQGIKESEKDKIFERFYRSDDSRTRISAGGYGLGLAIAKSIIDRHKFKVTIDNHEGESIAFNIIL